MMKTTFISSGMLTVITSMVAMGMHVAASAAEAAPASLQPLSTYGELDALRSQNAILAETIKNRDLKNKISNPDAPATAGMLPGAGSVYPGAGLPSFTPPAAQVRMVSGTSGHLTALIAMPNGSYVNARVGSTLAGVGQVKAISVNEVLVASKGQTVSLPFENETSGAVSMGPNTSLPQMQPIPPGFPGGVR